MQKQTEEILKKHLSNRSRVVLALSGGPDSVYLLYLLLDFQKQIRFKIIIAHVNHKLRGTESDLDEKFVRSLAKKHGLLFEGADLPKKDTGNLEEQSRDYRYSFLEKVRKKHRGTIIMTAHHRGDNIETALFNLARGSYLNGVTGMETWSPGKYLLRPLLNVTKEEIISYLNKTKIPFRTDKSNFDERFSRNRIRKNIIPEFRKINPNFDETFLDFMDSLAETAAWIEESESAWIKRYSFNKGIPLDRFLELPTVMQKNILASLYRKTHGNIRKFNRKHLDQILTVLRKNRTGLKKEFGDDQVIKIRKDRSGRKMILVLLASNI
jgi:tRNA(Ile)-lysidine synthase